MLEAKPKMETVHARMGHIGKPALKRICKAEGIAYRESFTCENCLEANLKHQISREPPETTTNYLEKVSSDICGPIKPKTIGNKRYFVTFLDDRTRYLDVDLLTSRDELSQAFTAWNTRSELQSGLKLLRLHSDNAKEYISGKLADILQQKGVVNTTTAPHTPAQNGKAERINLTLMQKVRAWLNASGADLRLWGAAIVAAAYVYNRTPHSALPDYASPYEARFRKTASLSGIFTWGSVTFTAKPHANLGKLENRAEKGIIIGYGSNQVQIYVHPNKIAWYRTGDTFIREGIFEKQSKNNSDLEIIDKEPVDQPVDKQNLQVNWDDFITVKSANTDGSIFYTKDYRIYEDLISGPNAANWKAAMTKHNNALLDLGAYRPIHRKKLPPDKQIIRGKWVTKLKTPINSEPIYKARWVLKGFQQIPGSNFTETYASTLNPIIYRLLLQLAAIYDWEMVLWDVMNAYPNADISEQLFAEIPHGFETDTSICQVFKAVNGLKQSA